MSEQDSKPVLTPLDVAGIIRDAGGVGQTYRPYFTERNALKVKAVLDEVYKAEASFFASCAAFKCSASALHTKLNDGLNWLRIHHADKVKYQSLRDCVKFRRISTGVNILWERKETYSTKALAPLAHDEVTKSWFDIFTSWLMSAKECDVFDSVAKLGGKVQITDEEEIALIRSCATLGAELDLHKDAGTFKVMR